MDRQDVEKTIAVLMTVYTVQARKFTESEIDGMIASWSILLDDLSPDLLQAAALKHASTQRFWPTPADLRSAASEIDDLTRSDHLEANDAWSEVSRALSRGLYEVDEEKGLMQFRASRADDWTDPLIQRAIDGIGGWRALRHSQNAAADRARFLQAYDRYKARQRQDKMIPSALQKAIAAVRAQSQNANAIDLRAAMQGYAQLLEG